MLGLGRYGHVPRASAVWAITVGFLAGALVANRLIARGDLIRPEPVTVKQARGVRKEAAEANPAVLGFLDMIRGEPIIRGRLGSEVHISGWAACADPTRHFQSAEVLVDGAVVARTVPTTSRPDVSAFYNRPDFEKSGWVSSFRVLSIGLGDHELTAKVDCSDGQSGHLPAFTLRVEERR